MNPIDPLFYRIANYLIAAFVVADWEKRDPLPHISTETVQWQIRSAKDFGEGSEDNILLLLENEPYVQRLDLVIIIFFSCNPREFARITGCNSI